jgi:hypothetical protein
MIFFLFPKKKTTNVQIRHQSGGKLGDVKCSWQTGKKKSHKNQIYVLLLPCQLELRYLLSSWTKPRMHPEVLQHPGLCTATAAAVPGRGGVEAMPALILVEEPGPRRSEKVSAHN